MNNVTPNQKEGVLKTLAILGLLGIIIFTAWISIKIVNVFPSAIQSLASLADSVYNHKIERVTEISLFPVTNNTLSGQEFKLAWSNTPATGTYTLTYVCVEGLVVKIKSADSDFSSTSCDTAYTLGLVDETLLTVSTSKTDDATFTYTLSYFKTNAHKATASITNTALVTNPKPVVIPKKEITTPAPVLATTTPVVQKPIEKPIVTAPKPVKPKPTYTYTEVVPVSNPNGYTDLKLTYLGIGKIRSNGTFDNTGELKKNQVGAIMFSVENIGTKTSSVWEFEASLPGDVSYKSKEQVVLKPNERATLVISFPAVENTKTQTFTLKTIGGNDVNSKNNYLSWSTQVTN